MRKNSWILSVGLLCACSRDAETTAPVENDTDRDYIARVKLQVAAPLEQGEVSTDQSEVADREGAPAFLAEGKRVIFLAPLRCRDAAAASEVTYQVELERVRCASLMQAAGSMGKAAGFSVADSSLLDGASDPVAAAREQNIDLLFALSPSSGAGPQPGSVIGYVVAYQRNPGEDRERIDASQGATQRCKHIASALLNNDPTLYAQMLRVAMTAIDVQSGAAFWEYSSTLHEPESAKLRDAWFEISTTVDRPDIEIPPNPEDVEAADRRDAARIGVGVGVGVALAILLQDPSTLLYTVPNAREGDQARQSRFVEGSFPSAEAAMCTSESRIRSNLPHLMQAPPPREEINASLIRRHQSLIQREASDFAAEVARIRATQTADANES